MDVQAKQEGGTSDNVYGAIIRKVDWNNYYNFLISGDGYYEIAKMVNGNWSPANWKRSDAINQGNETNLIRIICKGDEFSFYVNNALLAEYKDRSHSSGNIGLTTGTNYAKGPAEVSFDDLFIYYMGISSCLSYNLAALRSGILISDSSTEVIESNLIRMTGMSLVFSSTTSSLAASGSKPYMVRFRPLPSRICLIAFSFSAQL